MIATSWEAIASRAILLLLVLAFLAVTAIGVVGMSTSVIVAEAVQGSGSAINVAGSLRRLTHRASSLVVAEALGARLGAGEIERAIAQFETSFAHPALQKVLEREPGGRFAAIYRGVEAGWHGSLKPHLLAVAALQGTDASPPRAHAELLGEVDTFVEQINTLVAVLEHDAEGRIAQLRRILAAALAATLVVVIAALWLLHRRVFQPLADLRDSAARIARGDFGARSRHTGRDELGRLGDAFNAMAQELSAAYGELEQRVADKTADLTRSNRALELLYHVIARLYHAPASPETYADTLRDIERTLGVKGSFACVQAKHGGPATILGSTLGGCSARSANAQECASCPGPDPSWRYRSEGEFDILQVPLGDAEHVYGMLRLALPAGERLRDWQQVLLEAVTRHMGIALGISRQSERDRLLALQEERSIIARELHDSLAQSLSYMKIQVSLLGPVLEEPQRREEALDILGGLREGISAAYRQLRELLVTFRLRMEGDFARLLANTVEEFGTRSAIPIDLDIRLSGCHLSPNEEIHVLHIIREALSNATRHAEAARIAVRLSCREGEHVSVEIEDDGKGIATPMAGRPHHYGLAIMAERARGLGGKLQILPRPRGGTRVVVRFDPAANRVVAPDAALPVFGGPQTPSGFS